MLTPAQQILSTHTPNLLRECIKEGNRETIENINEIYQSAVILFKSNMAIVNNMAYISMMNAVDIIKKTPLYKGIVKKHINDAMRCYRMHEIRLRESTFFEAKDEAKASRQDLFDLYLDTGAHAYEKASKEIEQLRTQLYHALISCGKNKYTFELSHYLLAVYLLDYTQMIYDNIICDLKENTNVNFRGIFTYFRLDDVRHHWRACTPALSINVDKNENISEALYQNISLAFRALEVVTIQDMQTQNSLNHAIRDNQHLMSRKDFIEYCLEYNEKFEEYEQEHGTLRHSDLYHAE